MKKIGLKALSWALSLTMLTSMAVLPVGAVETNEPSGAIVDVQMSAEKFGDYEYSLNSDGVTITKYTGSDANVTIPGEIAGKKVTSIGYLAFSESGSAYSSLKSITIPDSVTSIGNSAFSECILLKSITIPDSVTSIGAQAFAFCYSLTSVTIPNSVTSISMSAFYNCISLTSIIIPNSLSSIDDWVFSECRSLANVEIPNSVTSIGDCAFDWSKIESIIIPDSVTSIGSGTFSYCSKLASIEIPNSVTIINDYLFYKCSSLKSITIPNSITNIKNDAFLDCNNLKDIYYTGTKEQWEKISIDSGNSNLTNATIHYNYIIPGTEPDYLSELNDYTEKEYIADFEKWYGSMRDTGILRILMNEEAFSAPIFVDQHDKDVYFKLMDKVVKFTTNALYRGTDGLKDIVFDDITSVDEAKRILAGFLKDAEIDTTAISKVKTGKKIADLFLSGFKYYNLSQPIRDAKRDEMEEVYKLLEDDTIGEQLVNGKFSDIIDVAKSKLKLKDDDPVIEQLNDYIYNGECAKTLSGELLDRIGTTVDVLSISIETYERLMELLALMEANDAYIDMLTYIKNNCTYDVVQRAADDLCEMINENQAKALLYVTKPLMEKAEDKVISEGVDIAVELIPFGKLYRSAFKLGVGLSNVILQTSSQQELQNTLRTSAFLSYSVKMYALNNIDSFYSTSDQSLKAEYAKRAVLGVGMLIKSRTIGEQAMKKFLEIVQTKKQREKSGYYKLALTNLNFLDSTEDVWLKDVDWQKMMTFTFSCPVDVEILNGNGEVVFTIEDGKETSGVVNDEVYYSCVYNPIDDDYVKIITIPENSEYSYRLNGNDIGAVNCSVMTTTTDGEVQISEVNNIPVEKGTVIDVPHPTENEQIVCTIKTGEKTDTAVFNVKSADKQVDMKSITLSENKLELHTGDKQHISVTVAPVDTTLSQVYWSSSNEDVATVNSDGVVTAVSEGTAEITAVNFDESVTAVCTVTVSAVPEYIGTLGDIDDDQTITANDALIILRASVGLDSITPEQTSLADVDGDSTITSGDALAVLRASVGFTDNDKIGKPIAA